MFYQLIYNTKEQTFDSAANYDMIINADVPYYNNGYEEFWANSDEEALEICHDILFFREVLFCEIYFGHSNIIYYL